MLYDVLSKVTGLQYAANRTDIEHSVAYVTSGVNVTSVTPNMWINDNITYAEALRRVASPDGVVLLALVDEGFIDMTINFYLTCLKPHSIDNYLILTMHPNTCSHLRPHGIQCKLYRTVAGSEKASSYGQAVYIAKMNLRTDLILEASDVGISVLHTDVDMYFMKNPLDYIKCPPDSCDIAALVDDKNMNAGFLFIRPTNASKAIYQSMRKMAQNSAKINDQVQLNNALKNNPNAKLIRLDKKQFVCGKWYYDVRYFADTASPCPECVVAHNNWIKGMEVKVYRAKEMQHWMYDGNKYYSSPSRRYLTYENVGKKKGEQLVALKTAFAIGRVLNRTVILPKFQLGGGKLVPLHLLIKIPKLNSVFSGKYREHMFLSHPLVPESVKASVYGPVDVITEQQQILDDKYILAKFMNIAQSILKLRALNVGFKFTTPTEQKEFTNLVSKI